MWKCIACLQCPKTITLHTQATHYINTNINNGYRASSLCCSQCHNTNITCNSRCNNKCNHRCNRPCSRLCSSQCNTLRITSRISNRLAVSLPAVLFFSRYFLSVLHLLVTIATNTQLAFKAASSLFLYQYPPLGNIRYHGQPLWRLPQPRITSMTDSSQSHWQSPYTP